MGNQNWEGVVNAYTVSGTTTGTKLENSKTLTAISPGAATAGLAFGVPPSVWQVGQLWRLTATGVFGQTAAEIESEIVPYFCAENKAIGEATSKPVLSAGTKFKTSATERKSIGWKLECTIRVLAIGSAGKVQASGMTLMLGTSTTTSQTFVFPTAESSTGGEAEWNMSKEGLLVLGAKLGAEAAGDNIQCLNWVIEILN